jgi:carbonic anhydrase/acetyltransferase-like protein (isoleucine patch superfamily)
VSVLTQKLSRIWFALRHRHEFGAIGQNAIVISPFRVDGGRNVVLGRRSFVQRGAWLYCVGQAGRPARLRLGDEVELGYNNHIAAVGEVVIEDHVLTANNVYISDNQHEFADIGTPIMHQPVRFTGAVRIGAGSWIGENACIVGASLGRNCVVGANAVVTRDVPDYCVVAGIPARIIRRYDPDTRAWHPVRPSDPDWSDRL